MQKDIYKSDYYYDLPEDLIAKYPVKNRTSSKLLQLDGGDIHIDEFISIQDELKDDDILLSLIHISEPTRRRGSY